MKITLYTEDFNPVEVEFGDFHVKIAEKIKEAVKEYLDLEDLYFHLDGKSISVLIADPDLKDLPQEDRVLQKHNLLISIEKFPVKF